MEIIIFLFAFMGIGFILRFTIMDFSLSGTIIGVFLVLVSAIIFYYKDKSERKTQAVLKSAMEDALSRDYKKHSNKIKNKNFSLNNAIDLNIKLLDRQMLFPLKIKMLLENDKLILFANPHVKQNYHDLGFNKIPYYEIPVAQIRYYLQTGEVISKTEGSGGHSSYSMVSGWNGKINPIEISTQIHDTKHTRLYFELDKKDIILTFDYDDFHKFKKILPLKDYDIVQTNLVQNENIKNNYNSNNIDFNYQLRSLKELFDEDIISEEEYSTKKAEILNKI